jgi:hypothetical protein
MKIRQLSSFSMQTDRRADSQADMAKPKNTKNSLMVSCVKAEI